MKSASAFRVMAYIATVNGPSLAGISLLHYLPGTPCLSATVIRSHRLRRTFEEENQLGPSGGIDLSWQ